MPDITKIKLTQGRIAIVDTADLPLLAGRKWQARRNWRSDTWYAIGTLRLPSGKRKTLLMHRVILGLEDPSIKTDHKDRNGLNNRRENLREATANQNRFNQDKRANSSSGLKGVSLHKRTGKFQASIGFNGKLYYLGLFTEREDAARAYDEKAREMHGEFAVTNY